MMAWTTCEACGWDCPDTGDEVVLCDECLAAAEAEARAVVAEEFDMLAWQMAMEVLTAARLERDAAASVDSDEPPF